MTKTLGGISFLLLLYLIIRNKYSNINYLFYCFVLCGYELSLYRVDD